MPPPRRPRLGGLNRPGKRAPRPPPPRPQDAVAKKCPACDCTEFIVDEGSTICKECYVQIDEANIVAEVTFEDSAGGRATVQGGTVADNSRHARTLGAGAYRKVGGGERNSLVDIQNTGRRNLEALCPKLGIAENVSIQANQIWTLAANINFCAGRKTTEVISACLYAACRRQPNNDILLMDIAEHQGINVFRLGEVYKSLCDNLMFNDESVGTQHLVELEPLIHKYCEKLQFGNKTGTVAEDALRIIRRMNRDWIVSGRHPAGLCGACIILAARMNNFQRSVREVVYVSKVADVTIAKRIAEFRRTRSSGLTVEQFRKLGNKITTQEDPPSLRNSELLERLMNKKRQKREDHIRELTQRATERESQSRASQQQPVIEIPDDVTDASSRSPSVEASAQSQPPSMMPTPPTTQSTQALPAETPADTSTAASNLPPATPAVDQQAGKRKSDDDHTSTAKRQKTVASVETAPGKRKNSEDLAGSSKRQKTTGAENGSSQLPQQAPRIDADGFAIPALPVPTPVDDSALEDSETAPKRGRGRPKKTAAKPPEVVIGPEELAEENYLEEEIQKALENGQVQEGKSEVEKAKEKAEEDQRILLQKERAQLLAGEQQKFDAQSTKDRRQAAGQDVFGEPTEWRPGEILTAEQLELEFENDPEVNNCLLNEAETKIKEQIWVSHNEDWLRKQAEKELLAKTASMNGTKKKSSKLTKNGKKRKNKSKMGDGTVISESATPIETPEDAAKAMLEKRAPQKSQHIDFSLLVRIYGRETPARSSADPEDRSGSQTPAASRQQSATPAPEGEADTSHQAPTNEETNEEAREGAEEEQANDDGQDDSDDEADYNLDEVRVGWNDLRPNGDPEDDDIEPEPEIDEFGAIYTGDNDIEGDEYY